MGKTYDKQRAISEKRKNSASARLLWKILIGFALLAAAAAAMGAA